MCVCDVHEYVIMYLCKSDNWEASSIQWGERLQPYCSRLPRWSAVDVALYTVLASGCSTNFDWSVYQRGLITSYK